MSARKTDKECAQAAVAAAIVGRSLDGTKTALHATLTPDEMQRAQNYLKSGQPITGN